MHVLAVGQCPSPPMTQDLTLATVLSIKTLHLRGPTSSFRNQPRSEACMGAVLQAILRSNVDTSGILEGFVFEDFVHQQLSRGGSFEYRVMKTPTKKMQQGRGRLPTAKAKGAVPGQPLMPQLPARAVVKVQRTIPRRASALRSRSYRLLHRPQHRQKHRRRRSPWARCRPGPQQASTTCSPTMTATRTLTPVQQQERH